MQSTEHLIVLVSKMGRITTKLMDWGISVAKVASAIKQKGQASQYSFIANFTEDLEGELISFENGSKIQFTDWSDFELIIGSLAVGVSLNDIYNAVVAGVGYNGMETGSDEIYANGITGTNGKKPYDEFKYTDSAPFLTPEDTLYYAKLVNPYASMSMSAEQLKQLAIKGMAAADYKPQADGQLPINIRNKTFDLQELIAMVQSCEYGLLTIAYVDSPDMMDGEWASLVGVFEMNDIVLFGVNKFDKGLSVMKTLTTNMDFMDIQFKKDTLLQFLGNLATTYDSISFEKVGNNFNGALLTSNSSGIKQQVPVIITKESLATKIYNQLIDGGIDYERFTGIDFDALPAKIKKFVNWCFKTYDQEQLAFRDYEEFLDWASGAI